MFCANHPTKPAVANCIKCGKPICADCMVTINDDAYCHNCLLITDRNHPKPSISYKIWVTASLLTALLGLIALYITGPFGLLIGGIITLIFTLFARIGLRKGEHAKMIILTTILGLLELIIGLIFSYGFYRALILIIVNGTL